MTEQEQNIVNNIANKLQVIIQKENITILMLSKLLKVDKQPLYRIMKREHIPNTYFLEMIANYLGCTIVELLDEKFFLDISVYNNLSLTQNNHKRYRVYVKDEYFLRVANNDFFGVAESSSIKIFYKIEKILNDGIYLVNNNGKLSEINILSVGSNLTIAMVNNVEKRFNHKEIEVFAKLYKNLPILPHEEYGKLLLNNY
jgi:transcriptional regulator with XRE-family HTH domain